MITILKKTKNEITDISPLKSLSNLIVLNLSNKMSKIIINQYIAKNILKIETNSWETWDKVHAYWQTNTCSHVAATDQICCNTGKDLGSRLYLRLVSSILWMKY